MFFEKMKVSCQKQSTFKMKKRCRKLGKLASFLRIQDKPIVTPNISMCACADGEINKFHFVYQTSKSLLVSKKK